jgi:putative transposase
MLAQKPGCSSSVPSTRPVGRGRPHQRPFNSDHRGPFTSWDFTEHVRRLGLLSSIGTVGDCYDCAPMESFWGSMQIEPLNRQKGRTKMELALAMAEYIEHFYNSNRRHSALGYLHPERIRRFTPTTTQQALCPKKWVQ